ncbi:MAG: CPXCG motif-containing cysteine-rich protein [Planctomycetaceae bacterium]
MEEGVAITCPWCGEEVRIYVDASGGEQRYVEDCWVCCRPIEIAVEIDRDGAVAARAERG